MRFKTFLSTYLLFVFIIVASLCIVSVYTTNSQMSMLKKKSEADFRLIAASLAKDIAVISARNMDDQDFKQDVNYLVDAYAKYYRKNNITLELEDFSDSSAEPKQQAELFFVKQEQKHFISVRGMLTGPFQYYRLSYSSDISNNVAELEDIQNVLLFLALIFSVITAISLHIILSGIFKPLGIVSQISSKIADGNYSEKIPVKGKNELSSMAENFNLMSTEIEKHIHLLEEEAVQKQQFVDSFAHEIRTPLTSIYGYAEYMLKARLDEEEIIESAQSIINEAGYMRKISDSLLELTTLRQYSPKEQAVKLPGMFADVVHSLQGLLPEKRAKIICACETEVLFGQEDLLRSLLLNLGFNALKACPESGGAVWLEAKEEKGKIILSVTDNGCGIPEESISKVVEPFYRVDKARSRESGGTGLGLTLCRQIVSAHNAQMCIESDLGQRTRVEIIFTSP